VRAPSFKAEIAAYRKKWIADSSDCPPTADQLAVKRWDPNSDCPPTAYQLALLSRWEEDFEWESCWKKLQKKLPPEAMPTAEEFMNLVLQQRDTAKCFAEVKRRTPTLAEAKRRAAAYLRDKTDAAELAKAHAELARDYDALARLNQMLARLGRQKKNIERKQFVRAWQDKFTELCGRPLNEVVLVMYRIVYGGDPDIGVIKGARRATTRHGRKGDTRLKK
jgi:hypothetical protein